jgi:hypothetical protein
MPSPDLERLADLGHLKREPPARAEVEGLIRSGAARLSDSENDEISPDGRFDLAYNAAHALALAALRLKGYRSDKRYLVFQALPLTLGTPAATWRLLSKCHDVRNRTEYEGVSQVDETLLKGLIEAGYALLSAVRALPLPSRTLHV